MRLYSSKSKVARTLEHTFLSFNEIQKEEGIYIPSKRELGAYRLIVLCTSNLAQVLVYNSIANEIYPALSSSTSWEEERFIKTPEKLELVLHP